MSNLANIAKRRRLNDATSTLSKPFKSPMRTSVTNNNDKATEIQPTVPNAEEPTPKTSTTTATTTSTLPPQPPKTFFSKPRAPKSSPPSETKDPELSALQKQHSNLLTQLSTLRRDLDTAQQALKIEQSGTDAELELLIAKWRGASREAAEEVFRGARERVNRMGGVGAWREMGRQRRGFWEEEEREKREEVEDESGERDRVEQQEGEEVEERDDETFTMDMMLRSLNIELDVIGFDKENQRWID